MEQGNAAELLAGWFGRPLAPALVAQLLRRTGGDLDLLAEIRDQVDPDGDGLDRMTIRWPPARVAPVAESLAGLGPDARGVLDAACVIGREFDLAVLERVAGDLDVPAGLDEAIAAGFVTPLPRQIFRFATALAKEVCYDGLGVRRRAELHERTAAALSALGALGGHRAATLVELAHHSAEAAVLGGPRRLDHAVAASASAGRAAGEAGSHALAAEYFSQAALLAGRAGWEPGPAGRLLVAAGEARLRAAVHERGREAGRASVLGALRLGRTAGDSGLIIAAALALGPPPTLGVFAPGGAACPQDADRVDALREAARCPDDDPSALARVRARLATQTGALDLASDAYDLARTSGDPRAVAEALLAAVHIETAADPAHPAEERLAQAVREAEALGDQELLARARDLSATSALRAGTRDTASRRLGALAAMADPAATALVRWYAARADAERARLDGDPDWPRAAESALAAGLAVEPPAARESDRLLRAQGQGRAAGSLTPRELEVLDWALRGTAAREIAQALVLAERTVETHLANVYRKLGVRSRIELIKKFGESSG